MNYFKYIPFRSNVATGIPVIHSKINFRIQKDMGWTRNDGHNNFRLLHTVGASEQSEENQGNETL